MSVLIEQLWTELEFTAYKYLRNLTQTLKVAVAQQYDDVVSLKPCGQNVSACQIGLYGTAAENNYLGQSFISCVQSGYHSALLFGNCFSNELC